MHNGRRREAKKDPAGSDNPTGHLRKEVDAVYHPSRPSLDLDSLYADERDPEGFDFVANPHTD